MTRTYVVTGAASGIGLATATLLEAQGHRVLGVDLRGATIEADLSTASGRAAMVEAVTEASGGTVDAVVANAGVTATDELCVRVNFFGAVATLEGLRPLLATSPAPRAVATASSSVMNEFLAPIVDTCLAGDEEVAVTAAAGSGYYAYPSTKRALARWVRREAPTDAWAGAGIALNAVAPGIVRTPMTDELFADEAMRPIMDAAVPMPYGGYAHPEHIAQVMAFLTSADTARVTGQVLFIDGGADAIGRGDDIFGPGVGL
jgi:NAD(P)-dependent dehydrogenase (short-subunit alcohol dehydrogenase family)